MTTPIRDAFLQGMSRAAQTVNIVSTDGVAGRAGVTVSAMTPVSADTPHPTLLICVHHAAQAASRILHNGTFCVNVLRDDQARIADTFAGRLKDQLTDKFECATWVNMPLGSPRVVDPLVAFDCKLSGQTRIGTHYVFMGEVQSVFVAASGTPLIYAHRAYGSHTRIAPAARPDLTAPAQRLSIACHPALGPPILPPLLRHMSQNGPLDLHLIEGDQRHAQDAILSGAVELALLHDLDLPPDLDLMPLFNLPPHVLLPPDHPLAARQSLTAADLGPHPLVMLNDPSLSDHLLAMLRGAGVTPRIAYRATSVDMVRGLVTQGLGLALAAAPMSDNPGLVTVPLATPSRHSRAVLATRRGVPLSPLAHRFTTLARDHFAPNA